MGVHQEIQHNALNMWMYVCRMDFCMCDKVYGSYEPKRTFEKQ